MAGELLALARLLKQSVQVVAVCNEIGFWTDAGLIGSPTAPWPPSFGEGHLGLVHEVSNQVAGLLRL